jgi:hypothetical protein
LMMKLLTIGDVWHGLSEVSRQDLVEAPCIMKRVKVYEKVVMSGMYHRSRRLCCPSAVLSLSAGAVNCVATLSTFTVMLCVEDERNILAGDEVQAQQ